MKYLTQGIHTIPDTEYFRDPCPEPSLTQSFVKVLLRRSARHLWYAHPRLNPDWQMDNDAQYAMAHVAHSLLMGNGRPIEIVDKPDWRTKEARELRDVAHAVGRAAVLVHQYEKAQQMVEAARKQFGDCGVPLEALDYALDAKRGGHWSEATLVAPYSIDSRTVWLRTKIDRLTPHLVIDYKTTQEIATNDVVGRKIVSDGWDVQAAMHRLLLGLVQPYGRTRKHIFLLQEAYEPFALQAVQLPEVAFQLGKEKIMMAARQFAECLATKRWPSYRACNGPVAYPEWAVAEWRARILIDHARRDEDDATA